VRADGREGRRAAQAADAACDLQARGRDRRTSGWPRPWRRIRSRRCERWSPRRSGEIPSKAALATPRTPRRGASSTRRSSPDQRSTSASATRRSSAGARRPGTASSAWAPPRRLTSGRCSAPVASHRSLSAALPAVAPAAAHVRRVPARARRRPAVAANDPARRRDRRRPGRRRGRCGGCWAHGRRGPAELDPPHRVHLPQRGHRRRPVPAPARSVAPTPGRPVPEPVPGESQVDRRRKVDPVARPRRRQVDRRVDRSMRRFVARARGDRGRESCNARLARRDPES
jgi:hypothetical protein